MGTTTTAIVGGLGASAAAFTLWAIPALCSRCKRCVRRHFFCRCRPLASCTCCAVHDRESTVCAEHHQNSVPVSGAKGQQPRPLPLVKGRP